MIARRVGASIVLWVALSAQAQTASTTPSTLDTQLQTQLDAIDTKAALVKDLTADFEQRKYSALLTEPLVTKGEVRAKANAMLWRGETPEPTRMRVTLSRMQIYYVKQKLIEDYPIAGKLGSLAASPLPRLATLKKRFAIARDNDADLSKPSDAHESLTLRLTPIEDDVKQYVDHIRVVLDPSRGIVTTFEITDPDGERTTIAFTNVRTNTGLEDSALDIGAPHDVKITKPLEPGK